MLCIADKNSYLASLPWKNYIGCGTNSLRALNAGAICLVCLTCYQILHRLRCSGSFPNEKESTSSETKDSSSIFVAHSALNISLFPPLFFFSGLYYTDVISTLLVLLNYSAFLKKVKGQWSFSDEMMTLLMGVAALFFRQTNIFWVAIFPAGLAVIDYLKKSHGSREDMSHLSAHEILEKSWTHGHLYDVPVADASFQGNLIISLHCLR